MKKFKLLTCLLVFVSASAVYSVPRRGQDLIPVNHWTYQALQMLYLEMGRSSLADNEPMPVTEFKACMQDIDYERLSKTGQKQYDRIKAYFEEPNWSVNIGMFSCGVEPSAAFESYYKTNDDVDWVYDYTKRQNVFDIPFKFNVGDYVSIYADVDVGQSRFEVERNKFFCNLPLSLDSIDAFIVHDSYLSAGYEFPHNVGLNFRLGLGPQKYGKTLMPSNIMSEYLTDTAYAQFKVYSPYVNYTCSITQFNKKTHLYMHNFELRMFKKFTLQAFECILPYDQFELKYLNPIGVFHGFGAYQNAPVNSYLGIKANFVPCDFLRIYAQLSQNEHQMLMEKEWPIPEGWSLQGGLETYVPIGPGYFHAGLEAYYSTPYLYIKDSPNFSFARTYYQLVGAGDYYQWMGSPYGPDTIAGKLVVGYEVPGVWSVEGFYSLAAMGENGGLKVLKNSGWSAWDIDKFNQTAWPFKDETINEISKQRTPHGVVQFVNTFSLKGTLAATPYLDINLQPSYVFITNYNNVPGVTKHSFEIAAGVKFYPTKLWFPKEARIWIDKKDKEKLAAENNSQNQ
ncbi:MAG: hypothetical protein MJ169_05950 [Treponema sp.]|nr:hypothetical protein [Treponema sp.]